MSSDPFDPLLALTLCEPWNSVLLTGFHSAQEDMAGGRAGGVRQKPGSLLVQSCLPAPCSPNTPDTGSEERPGEGHQQRPPKYSAVWPWFKALIRTGACAPRARHPDNGTNTQADTSPVRPVSALTLWSLTKNNEVG